MKPTIYRIAGIATLLALSAALPVRAETRTTHGGGWHDDARHGDRGGWREVERDRRELSQDYRELARDRADYARARAAGDFPAMRRESAEIRRDLAEIRRDRAELRHDLRSGPHEHRQAVSGRQHGSHGGGYRQANWRSGHSMHYR